MRLRVLIIESYDAVRESFSMHVESLGHEVIAVRSPELCPYLHADGQACSRQEPCCDALIVGQELPGVKGIEFIERKIRGDCKGVVVNHAIICRPCSYDENKRAVQLGCRFFETPIPLSAISAWLEDIANNTPRDRQLAPFTGIS